MERQNEFLFPEGPAPSIELPDFRTGFYQEVAQIWNLPLGQRARLELREHDLPEIAGVLELVRAPDLPFNSREPLRLCVGSISFLSSQVASWSIVG